MKFRIVFILFLTFCLIQLTYTQKSDKKIRISGLVTDAKGKPVEGVLIVVDTIKTKVMTNSKGSYRVKVSPAAKKILALSNFYGVKEMDINGKTSINFTFDRMKPESNENLNEENETINVGYGKMKKRDLSFSVSKLDGHKSQGQSYNNIYEMISGRCSGVRVSGTSINIQGAASFYNGTQPLFVVDGTIVDSIDDVIPSQVKSIEVLKGPSASIYGSRGANGVILITMIKGGDKK